VKEAIFHPEARAETRESFDFYEAHGLMGLVSGSCQPSSTPWSELLFTRKRVLPLLANSASGSFRAFPTISSIVSGKIIFTSLPWLTIVVVRAIGANEPTVASHRLKNDARRSRAS
jgi:hypothetical protein